MLSTNEVLPAAMAHSATAGRPTPSEGVLHWDPSIIHQLQALGNSLKDAAMHVTDLVKDQVVDKLGESGAALVAAPPPVQVGGSGRISVTASVMPYPPPNEIMNHLRLVRYSSDPAFSRGKNRAAALRTTVELLHSQPYLTAEHNGDMKERMNMHKQAVDRETPAAIRQRVPRILRALSPRVEHSANK